MRTVTVGIVVASLSLAQGFAVGQLPKLPGIPTPTDLKKVESRIIELQAELDRLQALKKKLQGTSDANYVERDFRPRDFKLGKYGAFRWEFSVVRVLDAESAVLRLPGDFDLPFKVKGVNTREWVDGAKVSISGIWEVRGVETVSGRRMFWLSKKTTPKEP